MPKCLNCENPAAYVIQNNAAGDQAFCDVHLPWFVNKKKLPDNVKKVTDLFKKPEPIIEEPVIEDPVVEEQNLEMNRALHGSTMEAVPEVVEAPKPKAPKKKKAAKE